MSSKRVRPRDLLIAAALLLAPPTAGWLLLGPLIEREPEPLDHSPRKAQRGGGPPDLLVVTLDTTRADHLGCYGYPRDTSPRLDELAAESLLFEQFVVPMATTLPCHTSLFTGLAPEEHGVLGNLSYTGERFVPPELISTFASYLQGIGYSTAGFVSGAPLKRATGIAEGFQHFDQPKGKERRASKTTRRTLNWLERNRDLEPLFLWVHYFDPHSPYAPPKRYRKLFEHDEDLDAHLQRREMAYKQTARLDRYDGEIAFMDAQLGELLDAFRAAGDWSNLVVLVAGDHGEGLRQHGQLMHGLVWHEQLHAPLLMRLPGHEARRVPQLLSASDVLPTLLGQLELPDEEAFLAQVSGQDVLAPDWQGRPILSRSSVRRANPKGKLEPVPSTFSLTSSQWKYTSSDDGSEALYHRSDDPFELRSILDDHPDLVAELRQSLTQRLEQQRARGEELGSGRTEELDEGMLEELKELGYVD